MHSRNNRDWLSCNVDTGEDGSSLRDTGQTFVENRRWQVRELKVKVILQWSNSSAFTDFDGHGSGLEQT